MRGGTIVHFASGQLTRCKQVFQLSNNRNTIKSHLTLSHLSAHVVNRPLRENRKSIPKHLMVKNFSSQCVRGKSFIVRKPEVHAKIFMW